MNSERREENKLPKRRIFDMLVVFLILIAAFFLLLVHFQISGRRIDSVFESVIVGIILIEICGMLVYYYFRKNVAQEEAKPLRSLFRIIAYMILVVVILSELNVNVTGILVSAGFLGIVLGLAAQSTLSNFISGVYLLSSKAFEPGDRVIMQTWQYSVMPPTYPHDKFIPGFAGIIKSIGVLYTELKSEEKSDEGSIMLVPNSIVAQALVINYHRESKTITKLQFDVDIKTNYRNIRRKIESAIRKYGKRIEYHTIEVDSFHNTFYVISVHLRLNNVTRSEIKNSIYEEILGFRGKVKNK